MRLGAQHDASELPADIREEIAAEIIDGKQESCADYTATNGQHHRWYPIYSDLTTAVR